jgi:hypothetical protein
MITPTPLEKTAVKLLGVPFAIGVGFATKLVIATELLAGGAEDLAPPHPAKTAKPIKKTAAHAAETIRRFISSPIN